MLSLPTASPTFLNSPFANASNIPSKVDFLANTSLATPSGDFHPAPTAGLTSHSNSVLEQISVTHSGNSTPALSFPPLLSKSSSSSGPSSTLTLPTQHSSKHKSTPSKSIVAISIALPLALVLVVSLSLLFLRRRRTTRRDKTSVDAFTEPEDAGIGDIEKRSITNAVNIPIGGLQPYRVPPPAFLSAIKTRTRVSATARGGAVGRWLTLRNPVSALGRAETPEAQVTIRTEGNDPSSVLGNPPFVLDPNTTVEEQVHEILRYAQQVGIIGRIDVEGVPPPEYASERMSPVDSADHVPRQSRQK